MIIRLLIIVHACYALQHAFQTRALGQFEQSWLETVGADHRPYFSTPQDQQGPFTLQPPKARQPGHLALTQSSPAPMADCDSSPAVAAVANTPSAELASWSSLLGSRPRHTSLRLPDASLAPQLRAISQW